MEVDLPAEIRGLGEVIRDYIEMKREEEELKKRIAELQIVKMNILREVVRKLFLVIELYACLKTQESKKRGE